ncbi:MAG: hypothetical protein ACRC62_21415 [Microcoleus sp.]
MSLLTTAIASDLVVSAKPTESGIAGEIRIDIRPNNLVILWRCSGGATWVGRCIAPDTGYGAPFFSAECNGHEYIDLNDNHHYTAATEGSTTWV